MKGDTCVLLGVKGLITKGLIKQKGYYNNINQYLHNRIYLRLFPVFFVRTLHFSLLFSCEFCGQFGILYFLLQEKRHSFVGLQVHAGRGGNAKSFSHFRVQQQEVLGQCTTARCHPVQHHTLCNTTGYDE